MRRAGPAHKPRSRRILDIYDKTVRNHACPANLWNPVFPVFFLSRLPLRPIERAAEDSRICDGATDSIMRSVCTFAYTSNKENGIKTKWNDLITLMSSKDSLKRALDAIKSPTSN